MGFVVEKTDRAGAEQAMAGLELMGRGTDHPAETAAFEQTAGGRYD
jgi:hydrogenase expression/formation protein HypC